MLRSIASTSSDPVFTLLRLALGIVFFAHGAQKMLGWFGGYGFSGTMGYFTHQLGIPAPVAFLVILVEFFGGLGLLVGFLSRIAALGIILEMVGAVLMIHRHFGFFMNWSGTQGGEGYEYHIVIVAAALAILIRGSGALSIDGRLAAPGS
jgi:putative oxidoreductase